MFILTDGKSYVMENPMRIGEYMATTSSVQAKEFTYKQARSLLQRKSKKYSWVNKYRIVDVSTGKEASSSPYYKGKNGIYIGENDIDFNEKILDDILLESESILGLAGWDIQQLKTYENLLGIALSKYDNAESDIEHALQKYKEEKNGRKPQAHKMAKVGYLLDEVRDKHKRIKQCISYVRVMEDAIENQYSIGKIKLELSKVKHVDYKGRTEYYKKTLELLG